MVDFSILIAISCVRKALKTEKAKMPSKKARMSPQKTRSPFTPARIFLNTTKRSMGKERTLRDIRNITGKIRKVDKINIQSC
jgi:hypothetical protein